jgi:TIR domain/WD domain, G-beta repeat
VASAPNQIMHDVFLSYAREDRARVSKLAEALGLQRGWSVWFDQRLRTGERFTREIEAALAAARCVLVVWSRHSADSDWVRAEAAEGWERGTLVPVRFEECEPPMPFRQTETADLTDWHGSTTAPTLLKLMDDIERVLARGAAVSPQELLQREQRRRALRRRRWLRRLAVAGAGVVACILAGLAYHAFSERQAGLRLAERLAGQADMARAEVLTLNPEEENTVWRSLLVDDEERLDRLEASILLAIEAVRVARTERTEQSLRDGLALLPWSDWHLEIDAENLIRAMDFNHDERLLAAAGDQGETLVWDFEAGEVRARIAHGGTNDRRPDRHVLDFSPSENVLATAGPDATARLWNPISGRELHSFAHDGTVTAVSFAPDGRQLASASEDGSVRLWDVGSGRELFRMPHGEAVVWVGFSPSGKYLASIGGRSARVWTVSSGTALVHFEHAEGPPEGASFSPDETFLATFGEDIETTLWEVQTGRQVWRLPQRSRGAAGAVYSPDGRVLAIGDTDGTLGWWNLERQEPMFSISQGYYILAMAQSADRMRLVTIADEEARVMDFATGRLLKRMPYSSRLTAVSLTRDARLLASSGWDDWGVGAIEVTRVWPDDPVAAACRKLRRNLTRDEWQKYLGDAPYRSTCPEIEAPEP